jgi:hypothetical protein
MIQERRCVWQVANLPISIYKEGAIPILDVPCAIYTWGKPEA